MQTPTVGRVVHYHSYGTPGGEFKPLPRAAVVTQVHAAATEDSEPEVGVCIMNPTGIFFGERIPFSEEPKPGHWSWPPRI